MIKSAAKKWNKPTSSKNIDKNVIEKNNNNILIGLIIESANNPSITSLKETQLKRIIAIAPIKQTIQYVSISTYFIFILGKNSIEQINNMHVNTEIIIVGNIFFSF